MKTFKTLLPLLFLMQMIVSCTGNKELSDAYGNFEADDVIISSEANGKLLAFDIETGNSIHAGKTVGYIDTINLVLQKKQMIAQKAAIASNLENIQSQIAIQEANKKNLMVDKNRVEKLLKDGAATQKQMDDINGQMDVIEQNIASIKTQKNVILAEQDVIKTQIAQVEESISKSRIVNPMDGIVLEKFAQENEITAFGKPLYKIANLDEITLRVYVDGSQLPKIKIGNYVEVLVDADEKNNRALTGTITWVSESAEFTPKIIQTKKERVNMVYAVKVKVKNDGSLKIGMPGEVNF
jgi:HlyD family secretion protein